MNPQRHRPHPWSALFAAVTAAVVFVLAASCSSPVLGGADAGLGPQVDAPQVDAFKMKACTGGTVACGLTCVTTATDGDNCGKCGNVCAAGEVCSGGSCGLFCSAGTSKCGSACVDEQVDPANCGACGKACGAGQVCSKGKCAISCGDGTSLCDSLCVDEQVDPAHCGSCTKSCGVGVACSGGQCATTCSAGLTLCTESADAGKTDATIADGGGFAGGCVDLDTDRANCGVCGKSCASGQICTAGTCVVTCPVGEIDCGGTCIDPSHDDQHCGAKGTCTGTSAGKVCAAGTVCNGAGVCAGTCATPEKLCTPDAGPAYCANEATDVANCGACGKACGAGQTCTAGKCVVSCGSPQTLCTPDGGAAYCADEQTDDLNCGACGKTCPTGQACTKGKCGTACKSPEALCTPDGGTPACADFRTDDNNCGSCGHACAPGQQCIAKVCQVTCAPPESLCTPGAAPDGGVDGGVDAALDASLDAASVDASVAPPYCANFQTDNTNCGGCGRVCPTGQTCSAGACVVGCQAPQTLCVPPAAAVDGGVDGGDVDGGEVPDAGNWYCADLSSDNNNCNGCGIVCPTATSCVNGACITPSYLLTAANFSGTQSVCNDGDLGGLYSTFTISWTDTLPPGTIISSATLQLAWYVSCPGPADVTLLNGTTFGPPTPEAPCACYGGTTVGTTSLPVGAYVVGGDNVITYIVGDLDAFLADGNGVVGAVTVEVAF